MALSAQRILRRARFFAALRLLKAALLFSPEFEAAFWSVFVMREAD